ncbi:MAG: hypothetical protein M5U10_06275 [Candidatus Methanoperedens sp.]|nr:hypothetical protein [Candidatus Methanoperedens sp.]MDJ1421503.1 hypothetical protein [Candidatus Methanoperedens sp.]
MIAPYLTYGWFPVGSHPNVKYEYKRKEKICVLGALNSEYFIYAFTDWLNGDVFKVFLQRLVYKFGKLVAVIDQKNKEHLHVVYFPSYSPELDPIEQSRRAAKKWLAIRYWENKSELKRQLITAFEEGITMVPIYEYLRT